MGLWTWIYSASMLKVLNETVKRRTNVLRVFPDNTSATHILGAVLVEIARELQVGNRWMGGSNRSRCRSQGRCSFVWHQFVETSDHNPSLA